ncbi:hypothetical protein F8M41_018196 [Gigaspora margarita]|uniref:Uncharacterized protein n=1 Tax=Gigaspora margarita TaxID=4874 RepID=A0A8H4ALY1_GIGMA|nr:hypothetical protein F8M41_018196 [Gigaspora margarita]
MKSIPQKKKISFSDTKSSKKCKSTSPKTFSKISSNASSDKKGSKESRSNSNSFLANILPKTAPEGSQSEAEILWPNPIEINFICKIIPNDVATICCKISLALGKIVQAPSAMIDSRANCSVISKGLIKLLGAEVDKNKKPSVKCCNNSVESSDISYNISVTVGQKENSCTISEDFLVMDDDKL